LITSDLDESHPFFVTLRESSFGLRSRSTFAYCLRIQN
jgi:hypothetical protein